MDVHANRILGDSLPKALTTLPETTSSAVLPSGAGKCVCNAFLVFPNGTTSCGIDAIFGTKETQLHEDYEAKAEEWTCLLWKLMDTTASQNARY